MGKRYSRRSMAIELLNGEYEKMVLRIEELEKENKLLKKKSDNMESLLDVTLFIIDGLPSTINASNPLPSMQGFHKPG